jgi:hypothetical protein
MAVPHGRSTLSLDRTMNIRGIHALCAIALTGLAASALASDVSSSLVGVWQDSPDLAAGWSDTYVFFPNGRYTFHLNTMNCEKRLLSVSGRWSIRSHDIHLVADLKVEWEGGHLEPSSGDCASEFVDARVRTRRIDPPQISTVRLGPVAVVIVPNHARPGTSQYLKVTLDWKEFWKLRDDPSEYETD